VVKSLLYFARKNLETLGPVDLNAIAREMVHLLSYTTLKRLQIVTDFQEPLGLIEGDGGALSHALINLCVNAVDAMPEGGTLELRTRQVDGCGVEISIRDTGSGMSPEVINKAIEPFFTTKPVGKGTGLGLAMVYGFVKQSGGTVRVYSELGHGTTVSFYLPLAGSLSHPVPADAATPMNSKLGGTVLVVDDEVDLLEVAVAYLAEMGFTTLQAIDGVSALDVIAKHPEIDLLVTDIVMPGGMNGVDLVQRARDLRPDLKIIYSSGFPAEALAERSMPLFDGPLLRKPYQRHEFAAIIHRVMEGDYATAEK
jgi:CheY-like chemotaxis protein